MLIVNIIWYYAPLLDCSLHLELSLCLFKEMKVNVFSCMCREHDK